MKPGFPPMQFKKKYRGRIAWRRELGVEWYNIPRMTLSLPSDVKETMEWNAARELNKGAVRTLGDMSEQEIAELERRYGCRCIGGSGAATATETASTVDSVSGPTTAQETP